MNPEALKPLFRHLGEIVIGAEDPTRMLVTASSRMRVSIPLS